jgi:hypothetical protein
MKTTFSADDVGRPTKPFLIPFALPGTDEDVEALRSLEWWSEQIERIGRGRGVRLFQLKELQADLAPLKKWKTSSPPPARERLHMLRRAAIGQLLSSLGRAVVEEGDRAAAKQLLDAVSFGVSCLEQAQLSEPELFAGLIKTKLQWPVFVRPDAKGSGNGKLQPVGLGADLLMGQGYRKKVLVNHHPPRAWAIGIKETLERNRTLFRYLLLKPKGQMPSWLKESLDPAPDWIVAACELPPFSKPTLKDWMEVGKLMLDQQRPDFHRDPSWSGIERRAQSRIRPGGKTRGVMRSHIFDSITKALKTIAAEPPSA